VLKVSGHPMTLAEFPSLRGAIPNANVGKHVIRVGAERASHLVIPVVDSRVQNGFRARSFISTSIRVSHPTPLQRLTLCFVAMRQIHSWDGEGPLAQDLPSLSNLCLFLDPTLSCS
jgi:hypothetical protein